MRHLKKGRKFGRVRNQRRALLKSLAASFFRYGKVKTTLAKAKELRPYAERIISKSKDNSLSSRREILKIFPPQVVAHILKEIAARVAGRSGGYTRVINLGRRKSDGAKMAIIEMVK